MMIYEAERRQSSSINLGSALHIDVQSVSVPWDNAHGIHWIGDGTGVVSRVKCDQKHQLKMSNYWFRNSLWWIYSCHTLRDSER